MRTITSKKDKYEQYSNVLPRVTLASYTGSFGAVHCQPKYEAKVTPSKHWTKFIPNNAHQYGFSVGAFTQGRHLSEPSFQAHTHNELSVLLSLKNTHYLE